MSALLEAPEKATLDDLLEELGGIPASRVLLRPAPGTASEADVIRLLHSPAKIICELIDGTLVEKAMGLKKSLVASETQYRLFDFVDKNDLGMVSGEQGTIKLWTGRIRIPDIAFFTWARLTGRGVLKEAVPHVIPDLAVEVLSEGNTRREMDLKREDYFRSGVRLVWEIDPDTRTVDVYTGVAKSRELAESDTLDGGDVLPGFELVVRKLFKKLDLLT